MRLSALLPIALLLSLTPAGAQLRGAIPASTALDRIAARHGEKLVERIVEMRGKNGQPTPREWWIVVHDDRSPYRLRTMWVGDVRATDEGENGDFYPGELPVGFAARAKLKIDSPAAFEVLVREATRAKIGFDVVDYKLRSMEFGDEPVWSLTAKDGRGAVVGRVILSGFDGAVLRTVWFYKQPSGYPRIVDSALDAPNRPVAPVTPPVSIDPEVPVPDPLAPPLAPAPVVPGALPAPIVPTAPVVPPVIEVPPLTDVPAPGDPGTERAEVEVVEPE